MFNAYLMEKQSPSPLMYTKPVVDRVSRPNGQPPRPPLRVRQVGVGRPDSLPTMHRYRALTVTKSDLKILERAFAAEISGRRYRGSARRIAALVAKGYLVREHGTHLGFAHEWIELTHLGRMTYCQSCPAPTEEENSP